MCFSFWASVFTGSLATLSSLYCISRNATYRDKWNGFWVLFLAAMQWYDAMLWYLHDNGEDLTTCSDTNWLITFAALSTIMMEPFGSLCGYMIAARKLVSLKTILFYLTVFWMIPCLARRLIGVNYDAFCGVDNDGENRVCGYVTETDHLMYGYARDSYGSFKCWNKYLFFGEMQEEIPLILRVAFLIGIIYPYKYSNPLMPGIINAVIVTLSWFLGYYTDAHASVWCWAASLQSIYIFIDPYLFPFGSTPQSKSLKFQYYSTGTKESRLQKKQHLKLLQCKYNSKTVNLKDKNYYDAIVIGSGIGGLTTAALMAQTGKKVLVLEQHYRAGGCMHTFDEFGGEFDSGIHYVGAIDRVKLLLSFITAKLVEWYPMGSKNDGIYDKIDLDGTNNEKSDAILYRAGRTNLVNELKRRFPNDSDGIDNYFEFLTEYGSKITNFYALSKIFPNLSWFDSDNWIYKSYIEPYMRYTKLTANEVIDKFIKNSKLKGVIGGGQLIDWCLIPKHVSWWVCAAMMNYYMDGGYYPKGGSNNIPLAIIPIIKQYGGNVVCQAKVKRILINKDTNEAYGVEMDKFGDKIYSNMIVSGVGAHNLYYQLLADPNHPCASARIEDTKEKEEKEETKDDLIMKELLCKREELNLMENIENKENDGLVSSYGHMTAFITLDGTSEELDLPDYNIHSWNNLKQYNYDISQIQELFYKDPLKYGKDALICLTFPSAKDPYYDIKFPNKSNALLLTEAKWEWFEEFGKTGISDNDDSNDNKYGKRSGNYIEFKQKFEEMFLDRLYKYCPKAKGKVLNIEIGTPLSSEYFLNTYKGGSYGLSWNTARFNHKFTKKFFHSEACGIKNLYQTGESILFGGFVGALCSGYITGIKILGWKKMVQIMLCARRVEE